MAIACVYCGGTHPTADQVKQCWQRGQAAPPVPPDDGPRVVAAIGRGPEQLGRNVVVGGGDRTPPDWMGCDRIRIDAATLDDPLTTIERLRHMGIGRQGAVIELLAAPLPGGTEHRPLHEIGARFAFEAD